MTLAKLSFLCDFLFRMFFETILLEITREPFVNTTHLDATRSIVLRYAAIDRGFHSKDDDSLCLTRKQFDLQALSLYTLYTIYLERCG